MKTYRERAKEALKGLPLERRLQEDEETTLDALAKLIRETEEYAFSIALSCYEVAYKSVPPEDLAKHTDDPATKRQSAAFLAVMQGLNTQVSALVRQALTDAVAKNMEA